MPPRDSLLVGARGRTIHTAQGVTVAYAPDDDMPAFKDWLRIAHLLAAAPDLAAALERAHALVREGNLFELKKLFASAAMRDLFIETKKEI